MIMASSHRQSVLVKDPRWKHGNIGYIDPTDPVKMIHGRQHYLIHWENSSYHAQYVDSLYVHKMEDISKMKHTQYSPNEVWISPEQRVSLEGLRKDRALGRRLFEESSSRQQRIVEEDETFELSIDPFAEVPLEETGQKRSPKPPPQHEVPPEETGQKRSPKPLPQHEVLPEETGQKRSPKPPPQQRQQAGEKRSTKRPPQEEGARLEAAEKSSRKAPPEERLRLKAAQERLRKPLPTRLQAAQKRSSQVGKEDVQASKPLPEESKKSPTLQETSKQCSQRRQLITEEDDEMFSCNVDPFSEELVDRFEAQDKNEAAESDQSL